MNPHLIRAAIGRLATVDRDSMTADFKTKKYYFRHSPFLWIDRHGVDYRADTLLAYLRQVDKMGFSSKRFRVQQITQDLDRLRRLQVGKSINTILARLEYNLTKAYLRYVIGQRFGFVNPKYIFNRLDIYKQDSLNISYRGLFDIGMDRPGPKFYHTALRKISADSVSEYLKEIQPRNKLYHRLIAVLNSNDVSLAGKEKLLCNIERCRWRLNDSPDRHSKYVWVNIPSFHLLAVDNDSVLSMRIGCGSMDTKTPQLTSSINRMDVNPQWVIPRSIIERDIIRHAGNKRYFDERRFFVRERRTGKRIDIAGVTPAMLQSKDYLVVQEGGEGNSLGRIIFRFNNNFSVFLHDTSSKDVFRQDNRGVSHGCIRIEKPFELAVFLLDNKDAEIINKIRYSMEADVSNIGHQSENADRKSPKKVLDRSRLIGSLPLKTPVPLFITYYTIYPSPQGTLQVFNDVYGFDRVIYNHLRNYR